MKRYYAVMESDGTPHGGTCLHVFKSQAERQMKEHRDCHRGKELTVQTLYSFSKEEINAMILLGGITLGIP